MIQNQYCMDASAIVAAWEERYPRDIFPTLWKNLAEKKDAFFFIKPIFDEIKAESPPLAEWLRKEGFRVLKLDKEEEVNNCAMELKHKYQTTQNAKGASPNDITLIAYAKIKNKIVVTTEADQLNHPLKKCNYKIPLVCKEEGVVCISDLVVFFRKLSIKVD